MTKTTTTYLNASIPKQLSCIRQATSLKSWEIFFILVLRAGRRINFRAVILLHPTYNNKGSQLGTWTRSVEYMKENTLPGSPRPPRIQELRVSTRESNASSFFGVFLDFLGCQCYSAGHQHCIQSTPPKVSWETASQRGELFHLVLFKPQKAILSPRI